MTIPGAPFRPKDKDPCCDARVHCFGIRSGVVVGLLVLALGVLFTLEAFNVLTWGQIWAYWPVALIVVGGACALWPAGSRVPGVIVALVGGALLVGLRWNMIWPALLILLGGLIIWHSLRGPRRRAIRAGAGGPGLISETVTLGGTEVKSNDQDFRGGNATAIMGSVEIDLRSAATGPQGAEIEVFVLMGEIKVRVPEDWEVASKVMPIMGSFEDKRRTVIREGRSAPPCRITVHGTVIMGSVEVHG